MADDILEDRDTRDLLIELKSGVNNLTLEIHDMKASVQRQWEAIDKESEKNSRQDVLLETIKNDAANAEKSIAEHKADHREHTTILLGVAAVFSGLIAKVVTWASK